MSKCDEIERLSKQVRRLKRALKIAMQNWSDTDDNWDNDKDNEWERLERIRKC